ncbi:hypothetical protein EDC04DRAFT_2915336 [Pisolithus marmoratus]|nr:hypothetical protein EDC04DRAFT_2915336 [Pisolithus marmoratus]
MPMVGPTNSEIIYTAGVNLQMPAESGHRIANQIGPISDIPDPPGLQVEFLTRYTLPMKQSTQIPDATTTNVRLAHMWALSETEVTYLERGIAEPSLHVAKTTWPRPEHPEREPDSSSQLRETERPQPDRDRAPEGCHSRPTCENPPVRIQEMGVHGRAEASEGDSANIDSTTIKVEIRSGSMETTGAPPYSPHLERHTKEPDREQASSSHGNADSREFVDSHGVRKAMLADRGCQHAACQTKQPNGLPASPKTPPNGLVNPPGTIRDPRRRGRMKTKPENVSKSGQTGCKRLMLLSMPISPPRHLSKYLWNVANTYWKKGIPPGRMQNDDKLVIFNTAASRLWYKVKMRAPHKDVRNGKLPQRGVANTTK